MATRPTGWFLFFFSTHDTVGTDPINYEKLGCQLTEKVKSSSPWRKLCFNGVVFESIIAYHKVHTDSLVGLKSPISLQWCCDRSSLSWLRQVLRSFTIIDYHFNFVLSFAVRRIFLGNRISYWHRGGHFALITVNFRNFPLTTILYPIYPVRRWKYSAFDIK